MECSHLICYTFSCVIIYFVCVCGYFSIESMQKEMLVYVLVWATGRLSVFMEKYKLRFSFLLRFSVIFVVGERVRGLDDCFLDSCSCG